MRVCVCEGVWERENDKCYIIIHFQRYIQTVYTYNIQYCICVAIYRWIHYNYFLSRLAK